MANLVNGTAMAPRYINTICQNCEKNNTTCKDDLACSALRVLKKICDEPSTLKKLEYLDEVRGYLLDIHYLST